MIKVITNKLMKIIILLNNHSIVKFVKNLYKTPHIINPIIKFV